MDAGLGWAAGLWVELGAFFVVARISSRNPVAPTRREMEHSSIWLFSLIMMIMVGLGASYAPVRIPGSICTLQKRRGVERSMQLSLGVPDFAKYIIPVCLDTATKTTVTNDPLAGMNPEEIAVYTTKIGGDLCGLPESARAIIGLALNLNLIALGVLIVTYGKIYEY